MGLDLGVLNNAIGGGRNDGGIVGTLSQHSLDKQRIALQKEALEAQSDFGHRELTLNNALERERLAVNAVDRDKTRAHLMGVANRTAKATEEAAKWTAYGSKWQAEESNIAARHRALGENANNERIQNRADIELANKLENEANTKLKEKQSAQADRLTRQLIILQGSKNPQDKMKAQEIRNTLLNFEKTRDVFNVKNRSEKASEDSFLFADQNEEGGIDLYTSTVDGVLQPILPGGALYDGGRGGTPFMQNEPSSSADNALIALFADDVKDKQLLRDHALMTAQAKPESERTLHDKRLIARVAKDNPDLHHVQLGVQSIEDETSLLRAQGARQKAENTNISARQAHNESTLTHQTNMIEGQTRKDWAAFQTQEGIRKGITADQAETAESQGLVETRPSQTAKTIAEQNAAAATAKSELTRTEAERPHIQQNVEAAQKIKNFENEAAVIVAEAGVPKAAMQAVIDRLSQSNQLHDEMYKPIDNFAVNSVEALSAQHSTSGLARTLGVSPLGNGLPSNPAQAQIYGRMVADNMMKNNEIPSNPREWMPEHVQLVQDRVKKGLSEGIKEWKKTGSKTFNFWRWLYNDNPNLGKDIPKLSNAQGAR